MLLNQIRSTFLDYFKKNNHEIVASSPLVPHNDPSLMFTNAGMVQFKNYFTGTEKPPYAKAASSQKCVRAGGKHNDLENVGYTARHHTFFEMLGNFSFGDYFKEQAIIHAWNVLTKEFSLKKDHLYITVYHDDDDAFKLWKKITGFGDEKIIRIPTYDNFWMMGDVGPCGPCSEIFFDHGDSVAGGLPGTPEQDGDRYMEIWNLVFMQYEDRAGGQRISLPKPSIDTGMGLERVSSVLQGKHNNFETDLFMSLIRASENFSNNNRDIVSHRIIADHLRSCSFLIADGVMPSNDGRGYVLRRIIRRAVRHAHHLGTKEALLYKLVPTLIREMGETYPELKRAEAIITTTLQLEEERFRNTLENGLKLLGDTTKELKSGDTFDGKTAFKLYDTFGFPLDLTADILKGRKIVVDQKGFDDEMQQQKTRARAAWKGSGEKATDEIWFQIHDAAGATEFLGYTENESEALIKAIVVDGKIVPSVAAGQAIIIVNQTPFYGESGGQIGDTGVLGNNNVIDTKKFAGSIFGHVIDVKEPLKVGQNVQMKIDHIRRSKIRANHSATHLLHKVLRSNLGEQVVQKGSLVAPDRLRFDFAFQRALTPEEVSIIETQVNLMIIANQPTATKLKTPEEAIKDGAMALFGEKYGSEVRVVSMLNSIELCGGTHVTATGDIGYFKIVSEESIAAGIRRIEALTGIAAVEFAANKEKTLAQILATVKCPEAEVLERVNTIIEDKRKLEKQLTDFRIKSALSGEINIMTIAGKEFQSKKFEGFPPQDLKNLVDGLKTKIKSGVIALATVFEGKVSLIVYVSPDLTATIKAGDLVKEAAKEINGSGGGKPDLAQAGGTDASGIERAFHSIATVLKSK